MHTLPELLSSLNNFTAWSEEENIERNLGLPIGSSQKLKDLSRQNINIIEQAKIQLTLLYNKWAEIIQVNNQTTNRGLGQQLLNQLKASDQILDQAVGLMAAFQVELSTYEGIVQRAKADNETWLKQAKAELAQVQATIADYKARLADAKRRGDRQAIASFSVGVILSDVREQQAVSGRNYMNERLTQCIALLASLGKMTSLIVTVRNLANAVDSNLEDAVKRETQALQTKSETLAAYYNREVGQELTQLFATL